jgi:general secretion pathway protein G
MVMYFLFSTIRSLRTALRRSKGWHGQAGPAQSSTGFTLIELLVVIAIIGLLSSVVLASLNSARTKGRDAKRLSDIKTLQLTLEIYYDSIGEYPNSASVANIQTALSVLTPSYIGAIPDDPNTGKDYYYISNAGSDSSSYCLGAALEGTANAADSCNTPELDATACDGALCTFRVGP